MLDKRHFPCAGGVVHSLEGTRLPRELSARRDWCMLVDVGPVCFLLIIQA